MLFSQDIGIDLGTANTLICVKHKGIVIREPSVVAVAVGAGQKKVVAVGEEAKKMIGRTPGSITAVRPIKDGVITDFQMTADMLRHFIKKAMGSSPFARARVMICIPSGVTEVERKAVHDAAVSAGARYVSLIEEPMAAAIGAGIDVTAPKGSMVVDIGGGTTEVAVISLGDIVCSRSLRVAGDMFDDAIVQFVRKKYSVLIGERTAEEIKMEIGSAFPVGDEKTMEVRGRDIVAGLPKTMTITSEEIRDALQEPVAAIVDAVRETLGNCEPELAADLVDRGIVLSGGSSQLRGLDKILSQQTGLPVTLADDPLSAVAEGTGVVMSELDFLAKNKSR